MKDYLEKTERYLRERLIPFWAERAAEPAYGGFQTNYDRNGRRTEVTEKTLLCQARCLFTISHAVRLGYDWEGWEEATGRGIEFLLGHFRDEEYGGYYWTTEEDGKAKDEAKVVYGHAFLIYGFSEHALLTGERRSAEEAAGIFELLQEKAADSVNGGYHEHFARDFSPASVREGTGHKSLDVHMHLMEAFTTLYELTGEETHRRALEEVTELIFGKMTDGKTGVGISMFRPDWTPISNVELATVWGSDRFNREGKPPDITSYGHNIELAWLYLHSLGVLGKEAREGEARVKPIFEHTHRHGVDWEHGGLFVEGRREGEATERNKEFWQQAEALAGFGDAYLLTGEEKYLEAFRNVHDFVFGKMISPEQGEWYPLLGREGNIIWDYMGHNWKTCYHTVRAMCEATARLRRITGTR
ncbi:MAG: AGE family epimerase/isomerase [Planctomycetes bacterium]|nr:AGE family epimerase/isomerase [Planctomycetota bacterium]